MMVSHLRGFDVPVSDGRIFVQDAGSGDAVVLIPPFACDTRAFKGLVCTLDRAGFRAICYDPRGYGRSSLPISDRPYAHSDDFLAVLAACGVDRAHLIGASNGARIAIDATLQHQKHVRSLTLIGPAVSHYPLEETAAAFGELGRIAKDKSVADARHALKQLGFFRPAYEQPCLARLFNAMLHDYSGYHLIHPDPEVTPDPPSNTRLGEIAVPTRVIIGEREVREYASMARTIAATIPNAALYVIEGVGHFANIEAPAVDTRIASFLASLDKKAKTGEYAHEG